MLNDALNPAKDRNIIEEFFDDQMGMPVVLVDSVFRAESGDASGIIVPDIPGLEAAMAMARVTDAFKLSGKELKFLRRAIGLKAVDLARFLEVTPETLSRWETGKEPMSPNAERVFRLRVFSALRSKAPGVKTELDSILNMQFRSLRLANEGTMMFKRMLVRGSDGIVEYVWYHEGPRQEVSSDKLRA